MSCIQFFVWAAVQQHAAGGAGVFFGDDPGVAHRLCRSTVQRCGIYVTGRRQGIPTPVVASLLMSMESVFAMLAGWVLLGRHCHPGILGCGLVFAGIILAQL